MVERQTLTPTLALTFTLTLNPGKFAEEMVVRLELPQLSTHAPPHSASPPFARSPRTMRKHHPPRPKPLALVDKDGVRSEDAAGSGTRLAREPASPGPYVTLVLTSPGPYVTIVWQGTGRAAMRAAVPPRLSTQRPMPA